MATMTLLEIVQEVLSNLSSDEVNSISDTSEAMQIATLVKQKYRDIVSRSAIPEHEQLIQLQPSNDPLSPTLMYVPDEVNSIKWIKYFNSSEVDGNVEGYAYVTVMPIEQFLDYINSYNITEDNVGTFEFNDNSNNFNTQFTFAYKNNQQPRFCTVISNYYVIFDAYDADEDTTLQADKTLCLGQVAPVFLMEDDFVPRLDDKQFALLVNEVKALAFYELKQQPHAKAEQEVRRQWVSVQKNKSLANKDSYFDQLPDFGRRTGRIYGTRQFR